MTNYEYLKKNGLLNLIREHFELLSLPFGDVYDDMDRATAIKWLLKERGEENVQLSEDPGEHI